VTNAAIMQTVILPDADAVAQRAASFIAAEARAAVAARGRFVFAVSGGHTPWAMLRALAGESMPWSVTHLFQVDERIAPDGDPDRNLTHIRQVLLGSVELAPGGLHAMPVNDPDLPAAAGRYAHEIERMAPPRAALDLVHLGLGPDGHTASLVPGDPALLVTNSDVALTDVYLGRKRMTLTYPALDRARRVLWVVTGAEKARMLARLRAGDRTIPAGRVRSDDAIVLADRAALGQDSAR
jgi:6-phosphogluconolactonase